LRDDPQPARLFGHQHGAVRKEGESPWMLQSVGDGLDADALALTFDDAWLPEGRAERCDEEADWQKQRDTPHARFLSRYRLMGKHTGEPQFQRLKLGCCRDSHTIRGPFRKPG